MFAGSLDFHPCEAMMEHVPLPHTPWYQGAKILTSAWQNVCPSSLWGDARGHLGESWDFHHRPVVRRPSPPQCQEHMGMWNCHLHPGVMRTSPPLGDSGGQVGNLDFCLHLVVTRWHPSALPQWFQTIPPKIGDLNEIYNLIICKCTGVKI